MLSLPERGSLVQFRLRRRDGLVLLLNVCFDVSYLAPQLRNGVCSLIHLAGRLCCQARIISPVRFAELLVGQISVLFVLQCLNHGVDGPNDCRELATVAERDPRRKQGQALVTSSFGGLAQQVHGHLEPARCLPTRDLLMLLDKRISLRSVRLLHEVPCIIVVQDLDRLAEGSNLRRAQRTPCLPLLLLLRQLCLGLLNESIVVRDLLGQGSDLVLGL
mmetsp:Transcript_59398/g.173784  ORF Transcript_59398/g.173784 Transcript_59398/m.173784 type:complete len:218 (+) Transcript_59398:711-1364(+)